MTIYLKHIFHALAFCSFIALLQFLIFHRDSNHIDPNQNDNDRREWYDQIWIVCTYLLRLLVLLPLPQIICNFLGLTLFNAFPGEIKSRQTNQDPTPGHAELPHFCFRVVTRGLFPELVKQNVRKNYSTCIGAGLSNFSIEVVTDKEVCLDEMDQKIRQLVVPKSYTTSTGAMFKARALQYALEPKTSLLNDGDYIVHLDEETLLTKNVINGIINFALDGKHAFGQGLITYTNQGVVNWFTTLADLFRVADDMGKLKFQFKAFHKPLFGWKGSFVVTKYEAERDVSFDHGPDGSVAEDCYFSMIAYKKGYTFDFIEGEMWEKSPFSISDLIKQRKRWLQGIWLAVHSSQIPVKNKFFLAMSLYAWITLPATGLRVIFSMAAPVASSIWIDSIGIFCLSVSLYMYIFGVLKSFEVKKTGVCMFFVYFLGAASSILLNVLVEYIAVIWGLCTQKYTFYIVEKHVASKIATEV